MIEDETMSNNVVVANKDLIAQQKAMDKELQARLPITHLPFNSEAVYVCIPSFESYREKVVQLTDITCADSQLIFSALNRACYIVFNLNKGTETDKKQFHTIGPSFIEFLNRIEISRDNRLGILKSFESYRVNECNVKPQSSGLATIRKLIKLAISDKDFQSSKTQEEIKYLFSLTKTKAAPKTKPKSFLNLSHWFSQFSWLRTDDIGIGHELFARFASPKATMKSFNATTQVAMIEVANAKKALISLIKVSPVLPHDLGVYKQRKVFRGTKSEHDVYVRKLFINIFEMLRAAYHSMEEHNGYLDNAIRLFLSENIRPSALTLYIQDFFENKPPKNSTDIVTSQDKLFFSLEFIKKLTHCVQSAKSEQFETPICRGEHMLFHWLMASQTIQASDISKLTINNFRFIRDRNQRISIIQCDYFKGRAQAVHETNDIPANSSLGMAILSFIKQRNPTLLPSKEKLTCSDEHIGITGSFHRFINFLDTQLKAKLAQEFDKEKASPVFIKALLALTKVASDKNIAKTILWPRKVFGPSRIKTSAVYAASDTFDPTQLINYHSHSNKTERVSYLTTANEEWLNNCGRITRSVMQDFTVNLFRASEEDKQSFNSEFTHARSYIEEKSADALARMRLVTGKDEGRVDNLGFTNALQSDDAYADTTYLVDSPETVLKLKHYLSEVSKKHHLLAKSSPKYLLFTVLPTVEWIESLFELKRFKSMAEGEELYAKFKSELPPLFSAHIR